MLRKIFTVPNAIRNVNPSARITNVVERVEKKVNGTFFEKWFLYWKNLYLDYRAAAVDAAKESKEKPFKTVTILSSLAFAYYCNRNNPDEVSFKDTYLRYMGDLILVSPTLQRKESAEHLQLIQTHYNYDEIRRMNLLLFSLIWIDNHANQCKTYVNICDYMKLSWLEFKDKIIDVGFLNEWWMLSKNMADYDVNY